MLKKLGLPVVALGAMLAIGTSKPANAQVQFGVQVGPPAYGYPACSVYDPYNPYACAPYAYDYSPYAYDYAPYAYPVYPAPYVYGGREYHRDHDGDRGYRGGYANRGNGVYRGGESFRGNGEFHGGGNGGFRSGGGSHGGGFHGGGHGGRR